MTEDALEGSNRSDSPDGRRAADGRVPDAEPAAGSFSFAARARSFRYAGNGIRVLLISQHNARIHLLATCLVVSLGLWLGVSALEWCALVLAIASVWVAEAINTALELLADAVSPLHHPLVGKAKDAAAGGVLIAAIAAVVIGVLVLGPHCLLRLTAG
jgi:diacylglycerol kinase (ATP)